MAKSTDEHQVSIRCTCGFWREQVTKRKDDADAIREEWANDHAKCGGFTLSIDPVELTDGRRRIRA